jgi:hypothetical protein
MGSPSAFFPFHSIGSSSTSISKWWRKLQFKTYSSPKWRWTVLLQNTLSRLGKGLPLASAPASTHNVKRMETTHPDFLVAKVTSSHAGWPGTGKHRLEPDHNIGNSVAVTIPCREPDIEGGKWRRKLWNKPYYVFWNFAVRFGTWPHCLNLPERAPKDMMLFDIEVIAKVCFAVNKLLVVYAT